MRNFFEHQDRARRTTRVLVVLMTIGVVAMGLALYFFLMGFTRLQLGRVAHAPPDLLQPRLLVAAVLGTGLLVAIASATRLVSLRGGGAQIAEMLGGRLISGNPRDVLEKRLLNVVEEMAIAAGTPVPQVFVLDDEVGINAFAAGYSPGDAAIAATRGCLEKLTREELQGVIAHELSHVLNGDMRLNIRLMGIVFGVACVALLGRALLNAGSRSRWISRKNNPAAVLIVVGLGVYLIGLVGELCSKLIKAAVSRQRELLADASAVQFTRNPQGIAGALKKIGGWKEGATVQSGRAEEASHFFFGDIHSSSFFGFFATHPPLQERIRRIDPSFRGEFPEVADMVAEPEDMPLTAFMSAQMGGGLAGRASGMQGSPNDPSGIVDSIGTAREHDFARAESILQAISAELTEAARVPFSAVAISFALLLSEEPHAQHKQREQIHLHASASLDRETMRWLSEVRGFPRSRRMSLLGFLLPALRQLSPEQRASFARTVQALIDTDDATTIFEHVVAETLRMRLYEQTPRERARTRHRSLASVREELRLVLSLIAHAGADDDASAQRAFDAAARRLPALKLTRIPHSDRALFGLSAALMELRGLAHRHMGDVIEAIAYCVLADRQVTQDEGALLHAVCDAFDCPLPPWAG